MIQLLLDTNTIKPLVSDRSTKMQTFSDYLREVVDYGNRQTGRLFQDEVLTHLPCGR